MSSIPSLDAHAHIKADLPRHEIATLDGFVLAATRSLDEAALAVARTDGRVVWGVGCHPGLVGVQRSFALSRFESLTEQSPVVSEIGLDGTSRVDPALQRTNFDAMLRSLQNRPRIVSVHSAQATGPVLDSIESFNSEGIVLHWWLGTPDETRRALDLGCMFSINSSTRSLALLSEVPADRVLAETDHPFGDRKGRSAARPGNVSDVEVQLARAMKADAALARLQIWKNLFDLASKTETIGLFPRAFRVQFVAL